MILLINICKEKLHYFEFVKPIEDILKKNNIRFTTKHYKEIGVSFNEKNFKNIDKIIICGTSLKDSMFLDDLNYFLWIKKVNKPVFGICGGMQIIGMLFNGKLKRNLGIGLKKTEFKKEFLGFFSEKDIYELHRFAIDFSSLKGIFEVYSENDSVQAFKHKFYRFYGTLFHPEVRNKDLIVNFCKFG